MSILNIDKFTDANLSSIEASGNLTEGANNNPLYQVHVVANEMRIMVSAYLPDSFSLGVTSEYDTPFAQGIETGIGAIDSIMKSPLARAATGSNFITQWMTAQVWSGSAPIAIQLPLVFIADTDPQKEVLKPIKDLMKLAMPSSGIGAIGDAKGFLQSPGPRVKIDKETQSISFDVRNPISIQIGKFLRFPSVVIENISQTYNTVFDSRGLPVRASVEITFKTFVTPTSEDIEKMFP
jgi:hypothetical protein